MPTTTAAPRHTIERAGAQRLSTETKASSEISELYACLSVGVHAIVNASATARELGHRLVLLRGPAPIDRVFGLTGAAENVDLQAEEMQDPAAEVHRGDRAQTAA